MSLPTAGTRPSEGRARLVVLVWHYNVWYQLSVDVLTFDPDSPVPPFEQVRAQLAAAIDDGRLEQSVRLPTVRQVAAELGLAVNTVAKAYRQLEMAGLIETRGRHGTFVAGVPTAKKAQAARAAQDFIRRMRALGIGNAEALAILSRELDRT